MTKRNPSARNPEREMIFVSGETFKSIISVCLCALVFFAFRVANVSNIVRVCALYVTDSPFLAFLFYDFFLIFRKGGE